MKNNTLSMGLDVKVFHEGLDEAYSHFAGIQVDEYMQGLVQEGITSKDALFNAMYVATTKRNVQEESRTLNNAIIAILRYFDLCAYDNDAEVKASAHRVREQFWAYGGALTHMSIARRLTAVDKLLNDLQGEAWQPHLSRLPQLAARLETMRTANDRLRQKRIEEDQDKGKEVKADSLSLLKRAAADKLAQLVDYLQVMAVKDTATYGELCSSVLTTIERHNAMSKARRSMASKQQEKTAADEPSQQPEKPTEGASVQPSEQPAEDATPRVTLTA